MLDVHFFWHHMVSIYYKDRDKPGYLDIAISACKKQIAVAPQAAKAFHADYAGQPLPGHKGYKQFSIILEKQKDFEGVIQLCQQAAAQGWAGDWFKRIQRCQKKMLKV